MSLTLDPQTEQLLQRELDRGIYRDSSKVIQRALRSLAREEEWLSENKDALNARLEESVAQIERGEGIPGDQLLQYLADRRIERSV